MTERPLGRYRCDVLAEANVWVSTILRESSAMEYVSPYFETMAFPIEGETDVLWQSAASYEREADRQHDLAVRWFSRRGAALSPGVSGEGEER